MGKDEEATLKRLHDYRGLIGQIVAVYLTRFLCSLRRTATVILIDGDDFEHGNEARMLVPDYYRNKAEALQAELAGQIVCYADSLFASHNS